MIKLNSYFPLKFGSKKKPLRQTSQLNETKKNKFISNNSIEESQECLQLLNFLSLNRTDIVFKNKASFKNISLNSLIKIFDFLNLPQLITLLNLNKKFRSIIINKSRLLLNYFSLLDYIKENQYIFHFYFQENNNSPELSVLINQIFDQFSMGLDSNQINYLIQVILTPFFQKENLIIENDDNKIKFQFLITSYNESKIKNLYLYDQLHTEFQIHCFSNIIIKMKTIESLNIIYPFSNQDLSYFCNAIINSRLECIKELNVTFLWQMNFQHNLFGSNIDHFNNSLELINVESLIGNLDLSLISTRKMISSNTFIKKLVIKGMRQTLTCDYSFFINSRSIHYFEFYDSPMSEFALKKFIQTLINCQNLKLRILSFEESLCDMNEDTFYFLGSEQNKIACLSTLIIKEIIEGEMLQGLFNGLKYNLTIKNLFVSHMDSISNESLLKCLKVNSSIENFEYNIGKFQSLKSSDFANPNVNIINKN